MPWRAVERDGGRQARIPGSGRRGPCRLNRDGQFSAGEQHRAAAFARQRERAAGVIGGNLARLALEIGAEQHRLDPGRARGLGRR